MPPINGGMSAQPSTTEPAVIRAGDTASWLISLPDYPASSGWALTYSLVNAAGRVTITSAASGDSHRVNVAPAVTAVYPPGLYEWQCRVSNGADAYTIRHGSIEIKADFSTGAAQDMRSHAQKTLAAIEAWIEKRDLAVAGYEIAGRAMKYIPIADLLLLRDRYRREVRQQAGKSGRVYTRF